MDIRDVDADFYLCLNEGTGEPQACWIKGRRRYGDRDDCMLVAVEPPIIGQTYGLGSEDIYHLLLATRWQGQTLLPISQWPTHTYVLRLLGKSAIDHPEIYQSRPNSLTGASCAEHTMRRTTLEADSPSRI